MSRVAFHKLKITPTLSSKGKSTYQTGGMVRWLRTFIALAEEWGSVPGTHKIITTTCNFSPKGSDTTANLCGLLAYI